MISGFKKTRGSTLFLLAAPRKTKRLPESGTPGSSTLGVLEVLAKSLENEPCESFENEENLKLSVFNHDWNREKLNEELSASDRSLSTTNYHDQ